MAKVTLRIVSARIVAVAFAAAATVVSAQTQVPAPVPAAASAMPETPLPKDYVIGVDDILTVSFWREPDLSGDVVVRPDGKITLSVFNDMQAAGLTPEQLRVRLTETARAKNVLEAPNVTVKVKEIKSRLVSVVGEVNKQGPVPILGPMTVLHLLSLAGGPTEFANKKNILIIRQESGKQLTFKFNYSDVSKGKNLQQNILLKPGDTVVVP
jgi:polysaccharide export outer membrane protein